MKQKDYRCKRYGSLKSVNEHSIEKKCYAKSLLFVYCFAVPRAEMKTKTI